MGYNTQSTVEINAPLEVVRREFFDFKTFKDWDSIIDIAPQSDLVPGKKLTVRVKDLNFTPVVVKVSDDEFAWEGLLGSRVLFSGIHYFKFAQKSPGVTTFTHGEDFSGVIFSLYHWWVKDKIDEPYREFNEQFKKRVELLSS